MLSDNPSSPTGRAGLTLVEVLVVVAVVGLLVALLLPAVQATREASRRMSCINNLRQFGIAIHSYESTVGCFPRGEQGFSPHAMLLPFMEQRALYNSMNFTAGHAAISSEVNATARLVRVSFFLCPSDSSLNAMGVSYPSNWGVGWGDKGPKPNGLFGDELNTPPHRFRDVVDGADTSAAMSEWCLGVPIDVRDPRRSIFQTRPMFDFDGLAEACHSLDTSNAQINRPFKGANWSRGGLGDTKYNHVLCPNDNTCTNASSPLPGAWTAGSVHPGGANLLFVSGRVVFIRSTVSRNIWRAMRTINGGELVTD